MMMMMMTTTTPLHMVTLALALALLTSCALVSGQFPVPSPSYAGFRLGRPCPNAVQISFELFVDPACVDTRDFFRDTFPQLYRTYFNSSHQASARSDGANGGTPVVGHVIFMPLPYHIASFEQTKASLWVMDAHPDRYVPFLLSNFEHFDYIANPAVEHLPHTQIRQHIFQHTMLPAGITDYDAYSRAMDTRELWERARTLFKYAVSRAPFGTPTFFVNGVQLVTKDTSFAFFDNLFQSLIADQKEQRMQQYRK